MLVSKKWLQRVLKKGESPKIDFKLELPLSTDQQKTEFAKDLSAIANTAGGRGHIIVGVDDSGTPRGIDDRTKLNEERLQQVATQRLDPAVKFTVGSLSLNSKRIVCIEIPRSLIRPHQVRKTGAFYIRRGTTTDTATTSEIVRMILRTIEAQRAKGGEYERYAPTERSEVLRLHILEALKKSGFRRRWMTLRGRNRSRRIPVVEGMVSGVRIRLYCLTFSGDLDRWSLYYTYEMIQEGWERLVSERRVDGRTADIFAFFCVGSVSRTRIREYCYDPCTLVQIGPSVIYSGLGLGSIDFEETYRYRLTACVPKLFVQNVKSRNDIERSLDMIKEWMAEQREILKHSMEMTRFIVKHAHPR